MQDKVISAQRATAIRWPYGAAGSALGVTLLFVLLRLSICPVTGLGTNEAYAIASGRLMSLSYFDHPPLHFWLAHLGELLFGDTTAARLPFIALGAGTSCLMFVLTRRLYGEDAGVWATLVLNLSIFFSLQSGNWILPDGSLNFFLLASALALAPVVEGKALNIWRWLLAGLFVGLAALSKYHALIFALGFFLFLFTSRFGRKLLATPGPWLAALLALVVFSPVLSWNAAHGWVSLRFQGDRAVSHHLGIRVFLSLLAAQLALLTPWVAVPLFLGLRQARPHLEEADRFLLWLGLPSAVFFSLVPLWSDGGMVQWAFPGWLLLLPLAAKYLADARRPTDWRRNWLVISTSLFLLFVGLAAAEIQTGWLGASFPSLFKRGDPTAENVEWQKLATVINQNNPGDSSRDIVITTGWREAAKIDQGLAGAYRVVVASNNPRNFAVDLEPANYEGHNGWIVAPAHLPARVTFGLVNCFASAQQVSNVVISRGDRPDAELTIWRGNHYEATHCNMHGFDG
jgi:hypothetical protein